MIPDVQTSLQEAATHRPTLMEARTSMLRFCAWCTGFMGSKPGEGVTHGICPECAEKVKQENEQLRKEAV